MDYQRYPFDLSTERTAPDKLRDVLRSPAGVAVKSFRFVRLTALRETEESLVEVSLREKSGINPNFFRS